MKIAIDLHCLQTEQSRNRGIGFFTENQIKTVLSLDADNEYLLLSNGYLPDPKMVKELRQSPRWRNLLLGSPAGRNMFTPGTYDVQAESIHRRYVEAILIREGVDLIHQTSPFEWEAYTPVQYSSARVIATVYDMIPLVFEEEYLGRLPEAFREKYLSTCEALSRVDRIITISECSKSDICRYLKVPADRVDVVYASVKECFTSLGNETEIQRVRRSYGLEDGFVLCTGGIDYRKNIERVIEAFSLLPQPVRTKKQLVIVCRVLPEEAQLLRSVAERFGVADRLVLTNYVSDDTLVALYNAADVFLFPSLYEGFGLPVLEALHCGAAVVTSKTSSLPEVAGDAALLVDPCSPGEIADAVAEVLVNTSLREDLGTKALQQATKFSTEQVARRTLEAYGQVTLVEEEGKSFSFIPEKPKIAFFSPLNPQKSGVCEVSEDLLPFLGEHFDIDLFVDGYAPSNTAITGRFPVFDFRHFESVAAGRHYDLNLYHMGNSTYHDYIYHTLMRHPGIVVMHDVVLHGLIYHMTAIKGQHTAYVEEMQFCHGEEGKREAEKALANGITVEQLYRFAANKRVINAATGVIAHSDWACSEIRKHGLNVPVTKIDMGVEILDSSLLSSERAVLLEELGLPQEASFVVSSFGSVAVTKRPTVVVRAFARFLRRHPQAVLLFIGELHTAEVTSLIRDLGIGGNVRVTGYLNKHSTGKDFMDYLRISDVCINLRYPSAGETSGAVTKIMGLGKPQIISALNQFKEIPDECCWKLDLDEHEEDLLVAYLLELAGNGALKDRMGENSRRYALENHGLERSALNYKRFIEDFVSSNRGMRAEVVEVIQ